MNIDKAVQFIAEKVYQTGHPTSGTVRQLFSSLGLTESDLDILAMEGLSGRVNSLLVSGGFESANPKPQQVIIETHFEPTVADKAAGRTQPSRIQPAPIKISVDVEILHNTLLQVHGVRKPIIEFTSRDLDYMLRLYGAEIKGYSARTEVFEYAQSRLKTLKKTRISDLANGEQTILARKWKATTKINEKTAVA